MLNADMALVSDFETHIDGDGQVTCAMQDFIENDLPLCRQASTIQQVIEYSNDNMLWLEDFRDVLTEMTLNGYFPGVCNNPPCVV